MRTALNIGDKRAIDTTAYFTEKKMKCPEDGIDLSNEFRCSACGKFFNPDFIAFEYNANGSKMSDFVDLANRRVVDAMTIPADRFSNRKEFETHVMGVFPDPLEEIEQRANIRKGDI